MVLFDADAESCVRFANGLRVTEIDQQEKISTLSVKISRPALLIDQGAILDGVSGIRSQYSCTLSRYSPLNTKSHSFQMFNTYPHIHIHAQSYIHT